MKYGTFLQGDTLQEFATRELGNGSRWREIVELNGLVPPYVAEPPAYLGANLAKPGQRLLIDGTTDADIYGTDVALNNGLLEASAGGDFLLTSGVENLKGALTRRVRTERGRLYFYPNYGCKAPLLIGQPANEVTAQLAGVYVEAALKQDPRVIDASVTPSFAGDAVQADAEVLVKSGETLSLPKVMK